MKYTFTELPCLTVARSGTAGFVSFQKFGCVVGDSAKILLLKCAKYSTDNVLLFLQALLSANRYKFTYGYKVTTRKYANLELELPVTNEGIPDWQFMEDYIKSLHSKKITTRNKAENVPELNVKKWKEFRVGKWFGVSIANSNDLGNLSEGNIPFIGRTDIDNGKQAVVCVEKKDVQNAGCITISMVGTNVALWQPYDFTASQNIATIRNKALNEFTGLFICCLINNEMKYKFSYGRTVGKKDIENMLIKMPVKVDGTPDWQYMEDYIKSLPYGDRI